MTEGKGAAGGGRPHGEYALRVPDADLGYKTPFPLPFEPSFVYNPYIPFPGSKRPVFFTPEDFKPLRKQAYLCAHCLTVRQSQWSRSCCLDFSTQPVSTSQALGWI